MKEYLSKNKKLFEDYLLLKLQYIENAVNPVADAVRYALDGGKRLRPVLCVLGAEFMGKGFEEVKDIALGLECIHNYSLCHDDMPCMDNDDLRHGKPSVHKKFGEGMALLTGDALLNLAFEFMLEGEHNQNYYNAIKYISNMSGIHGMIGGQCIDIASEDFRDKTLFEVIKLNLLKTACLFKGALCGSAISLGVSSSQLKDLETYAEKVGLIFQIVDDILDITASEEELGKNINSDFKMNKTTYLSIVGMEKAKQDVEKLEQEAINAIEKYGEASQNLINFAKFLTKRSK